MHPMRLSGCAHAANPRAASAPTIQTLCRKNWQSAPIVHFNGPLTMGSYRQTPALVRGQTTDFYTFVGTSGTGQGTMTPIANTEIPSDAHPVATFEFPAKDPGKSPLVVKSILKTRC